MYKKYNIETRYKINNWKYIVCNYKKKAYIEKKAPEIRAPGKRVRISFFHFFKGTSVQIEF